LSAEQWFDLGCRHEDAGRLHEAEADYRQALLAGGPDVACCFNLANVLYALDRKPEAAERLYQAIELDAHDAAVWNNLASVFAALNLFDEAKAAYRKAVALGHADAHYNLADLLCDLGEHEEARRHWQAYLQQDQHSRWARYARSRLEKTS
jgi:tetratricopeptide (TPR) repeat protein